CRKQLVIPRWPSIVNDDEDPAGNDTTLWDSPDLAVSSCSVGAAGGTGAVARGTVALHDAAVAGPDGAAVASGKHRPVST
ncbi:hypothetical protein, partial [Microbacterium luticocti]|uniref:hypothetical protein n=1 Tax=Microbacterium luticocti TaxID=451764 RepID=UPI001B7FB798